MPLVGMGCVTGQTGQAVLAGVVWVGAFGQRSNIELRVEEVADEQATCRVMARHAAVGTARTHPSMEPRSWRSWRGLGNLSTGVPRTPVPHTPSAAAVVGRSQHEVRS